METGCGGNSDCLHDNNWTIMRREPFLIKNKVMEPMIPTTSDLYDDVQESRIQIVQAINGYLTISMVYESFKLLWSFWHYQETCADYAYLSIGFMILDLIWAVISYRGFRAIRTKNSRNVKLFGYALAGNFVLRLIMYIVVGVVMKGYANQYIQITPEQYNNIICSALYPEALYVIEGIIEAVLSLFVMYLTNNIYKYVVKFEENETYKYTPQPLHDY